MTLPLTLPSGRQLRDFRAEDLAAYQALRSEAKFGRFYAAEDCSPARSAELLQMFMAQAQQRPRQRFQLAIVSAADELMGSCGVRIEAPGQGSIGCELGRHWQGSGAALEAARAIVAFGFCELGLQQIYADTKAGNLAALRLCRQLGMRPEPTGTAGAEGVRLLLAREDWQAEGEA